MIYTKNSLWRSVAALVFLAVMVCPAMAADKKATNNKPVALVNGKEIPRGTFEAELSKAREQYEQQGKTLSEEQIASLKEGILDRFIRIEVLWQEALKKNISVDEKEIMEQKSQLKERFPDDKAFEAALKNMGITESELNDKLRQSAAIQELIEEEVAKKVTVPEKEMKAFYEQNPQYFKEEPQVKANHILIKVEENATEAEKAQAKKKITEIQDKLKKGADFAALAKEHSQCPSSAQGGDLGFFGRGQMVKPFEDAAFALKEGQISDVVETPFGYHLIKVTEKKEAKTLSFDEAKEKIEQFLIQKQVKQEVDQYIAKLVKEAKIEKFL